MTNIRCIVRVFVFGTIVGPLLAPSSPARADDQCEQPLAKPIRDALAVHYSCDLKGYRCIDGHVGRAFVESQLEDYKDRGDLERTGYFDGNRYYETGVVGTDVHVFVFALTECAPERLGGLVFKERTIKNQNTNTEGKPRTSKEVAEGLAAQASAKVLEAKALVDSHSSSPQSDPGLKAALDGLQTDVAKIESRAKRNQLSDQLTGNLANLEDEIKGLSQQPTQQNFVAARPKVDDLAKLIEAAAAKQDVAAPWPVIRVSGVSISVQTHITPVPAGDDNAWFTVMSSNLVKASADASDTTVRSIWPEATLTVKVDHGRYYWGAGFLFTAVFHGKRVFNGAKTECSDACKWASQPMLSGTVYPMGRPKFEVYAHRNWWPGLQVGINADLTKISDAISLGFIEQPINGLAISGGVMLYSRARAPIPAAPDANQPMETRLLPYVGVTLTSEFFDTIKALGSAGKGKGVAGEKNNE